MRTDVNVTHKVTRLERCEISNGANKVGLVLYCFLPHRHGDYHWLLNSEVALAHCSMSEGASVWILLCLECFKYFMEAPVQSLSAFVFTMVHSTVRMIREVRLRQLFSVAPWNLCSQCQFVYQNVQQMFARANCTCQWVDSVKVNHYVGIRKKFLFYSKTLQLLTLFCPVPTLPSVPLCLSPLLHRWVCPLLLSRLCFISKIKAHLKAVCVTVSDTFGLMLISCFWG